MQEWVTCDVFRSSEVSCMCVSTAFDVEISRVFKGPSFQR